MIGTTPPPRKQSCTSRNSSRPSCSSRSSCLVCLHLQFQRWRAAELTFLALEPMLLATTLYMSYIYGIVYLLVSAVLAEWDGGGADLAASSRPSRSSSSRTTASMSARTVCASSAFSRAESSASSCTSPDLSPPFETSGVLTGASFVTIIEPRYLKYAHKLAPQMPQPEKRLELCIISGWTLVIAMFWFGWTSYSSIHWISPVLAGGLIGFSVLGMFVSL